jgi:hypothetical protein
LSAVDTALAYEVAVDKMEGMYLLAECTDATEIGRKNVN